MKKTLRSHQRVECFLTGECRSPWTNLKRVSYLLILDLLFFLRMWCLTIWMLICKPAHQMYHRSYTQDLACRSLTSIDVGNYHK